jgi:hypothetical protein
MSSGQYSADGRWYWDGSRWLAVGRAAADQPTPVQPSLAPGVHPYYSPKSRSKWLTRSLVAMIVTASMLLLAFGVELLAAALGGAAAGVAITLIASGPAFIGVIVVQVMMILWLFRCCRNLPALGAPKRLFAQPAWAIVAWFIPNAGTVLPCLVVCSTWRASDPSKRHGIGIVVWWWITFVVAANVVVAALFMPILGLDQGNPDQRVTEVSAIVGAIGCIVALLATWLAIRVARSLTALQDEMYRTLPVQAVPPS